MQKQVSANDQNLENTRNSIPENLFEKSFQKQRTDLQSSPNTPATHERPQFNNGHMKLRENTNQYGDKHTKFNHNANNLYKNSTSNNNTSCPNLNSTKK